MQKLVGPFGSDRDIRQILPETWALDDCVRDSELRSPAMTVTVMIIHTMQFQNQYRHGNGFVSDVVLLREGVAFKADGTGAMAISWAKAAVVQQMIAATGGLVGKSFTW
eukprot:2924192-Rhodomonas_salina.4